MSPAAARLAAAVGAALVVAAGRVAAGDADRLLFHAETVAGEVLASRSGDRLFNPASVVKVGTSLFALERLGADHRYATAFACTGALDREAGMLRGDLVVRGGGDPDFQRENVFLVARELNRLGVRRVSGGLVVEGLFWCGWEQGATHQITNPDRRARVMGGRVIAALDPRRWDHTARSSWEAMCARRGWSSSPLPSVVVAGSARVGEAPAAKPLVRHLSNPLVVLLRRFNVYSNNDIIRVADGLGGVEALAAFLTDRLRVPSSRLRLETASGEGRNRMTPRIVVALVRDLRATLGRLGLGLGAVLPQLGCDPGPTRRMFPTLVGGPDARSVVCKTGTLSTTDGGVAVLAGSFIAREGGEVLFCVAAPRAGGALRRWRFIEQGWLLDLIAARGGAMPRRCGRELPFSDADAAVVDESGWSPL